MWTPITHSDQLPGEGTPEQAWLDFKAQPTSEAHERAKDVAAFANAMGGTLIIGAAGGSTLTRYLQMQPDDANRIVRDYHEAVRDRVRPPPIFEAHALDKDGGKVVVVNVQPFPGQAVAVELKRPDETNLPDVFRFPVRVGTETKFITPEQLPMFFDAKARRIAIALEQLQSSNPHVELFYRKLNHQPPSPVRATIAGVNLQSNTLELSHVNGQKSVNMPLDFVESVCAGTPGHPGQLYLNGFILTSLVETRFYRSE